MMYVLLWVDRHTDPEIELFQSQEVAINRAKEIAKKHARNPADIREGSYPGWAYFVQYSCDDCYVRVEAKEYPAPEFVVKPGTLHGLEIPFVLVQPE